MNPAQLSLELLSRLCRLYHLGTSSQVVPLAGGTSTSAWQLDCENGVFLLRSLRGPAQGQTEWAVYRHLAARGFAQTPEIRLTTADTPFVELDGGCYQLQAFCPGERPDPNKSEVPEAIATLAVRLTQTLADCTLPETTGDRFDLSAVWRTYRENWPLLELSAPAAQAEEEVEALCALPCRDIQVIHGDLGPWNMLDHQGRIQVIDFGEVRMGDPYFDLASALGGIINHTSPQHRDEAVWAYLSRCDSLLPGLDRARLNEQLRLWAWGGLAQCLREPEKWRAMARRFWNALEQTSQI